MALIVTIIVLLILAGVSIATLAGNNGLISRTTIAKEATRAGEVKELVRLEAQANKIAETTNDTQKTRSAVIAELVADGKLTSAEAEEIQSAENPTITIGGITIDFSILPGNPVTPADPTATFGEANSTYSSYFGKLVTGYNPTSGNNWRLFYADSNYAYLICDNLDERTYIALSGYGESTISTLAQNFNSKFTSWNEQAENNNIKAVAALMDTSKWIDYKTSDAEWAVGAPTLEMFIASYNATHAQQLDCQVVDSTATGYQVKKGSEEWANSVEDLGYTSDLDRSIYFNDLYFYFIASPSASDEEEVMATSDWGSLRSIDQFSGAARRPLVSVPISKIGLSSENKTITITNNYFNN